jgi:hypothetical protein
MISERYKKQILLLVITFIFFAYMTGLNLNYLNPRNIDWIFFAGNLEDGSLYWFGWEFFRWTNIIQYPLLDNYPYGEELNISLIYNDSIPIMSIFLKFFTNYLGFPFQFFGLWHLICIYLQALFTLKILDMFINSKRIKFLLISIILLTPVLVFSLLLNHASLFANWIIIASIYFYLKPKFKYSFWLTLIVVSLLTQAYLFAMILPIFIADLVQRVLKKELRISDLFKFLGITILLIASLFMLLGVETSKDTYHFYQGYGHFRMNLNSIFDSSVSFVSEDNYEIYRFSRLMPDLKDTTSIAGSGDHEGFNFLGIPVISLLILSILNFKKGVLNFSRKNYIPILIISLLLLMFALTNKIIFNEILLITYPLPSFIKNFFATFRSSGRFFWPVLYIISFISFYSFTRLFNKKSCTIILSILLMITFIDSFEMYSKARAIKSVKLSYKGPTWKQLLKDPEWDQLALKYSKVKFIYPDILPTDFTSKVNLFAVSNGLSVNGGYLARVKKSTLLRVRKKLKDAITACNFENDSIYVFSDKELWHKASLCSPANKVLEIDGIYVLGPSQELNILRLNESYKKK